MTAISSLAFPGVESLKGGNAPVGRSLLACTSCSEEHFIFFFVMDQYGCCDVCAMILLGKDVNGYAR